MPNPTPWRPYTIVFLRTRRQRGATSESTADRRSIDDRDLDDEGIATFLQHAASLGAPVFVHPWDMPTSPRLERWMAQWLAGMPAETHLSILALILGGVLDKVGDDLRIEVMSPVEATEYSLERVRKGADTIYGGSNQIQRNVIGEQALGLPKEPR